MDWRPLLLEQPVFLWSWVVCVCVCAHSTERKRPAAGIVCVTPWDLVGAGVVLHVLVLLRRGGVSWFDSQEVRGDRWTWWCGVSGEGVDSGQLCPDTQSRSHALALAIVVWNLRNPFDQHGVSVWVLFWMAPEDKTAIRQGKERTDRGDTVQGLPDEYTNLQHIWKLRPRPKTQHFHQQECSTTCLEHSNQMQSFRKKKKSRRWKRKKNNIPVHIVWMTRVERRSTLRYFICPCTILHLCTQRESHLFSLTSAFLRLRVNARSERVCMCVRDKCSPSD